MSDNDTVNIVLKREYAILLLQKMTQSFTSEGYGGAKALIEICDAFTDALQGEE